ncbi:MAG: O-antigen ligase family protein [Patescibacteria group bacterium]
MKNFFNRQFNLVFLLIILVELISFAGYLFPLINIFVFFALIILVLILSLYRLEYGLAILLTELFINSKGYLFFLTVDKTTISLRMAFWLVIISVWLGKTVVAWIKNKKLSIAFCKSNYYSYFITFFIFIIWGAVNGLIKHNQLDNLFFDFNAWLYFALIFPIYEILQQEKNIQLIGQAFIASITWVGLKTLFLLFVFSHNLIIAPFVLYGWIRNTGVGEITQIQNNFFRIFFQSHIFVLVAFFIFSMILVKLINDKTWQQNFKLFFINFLLLILSLTTILSSFSRSFWLGLIGGVLACWLIWLLIIKINFKQFLLFNCLWLLTAIFSISLVIIIVKFPYPTSVGNFNITNVFTDRVSQLTGKAGISSRWALLPKLWQKIVKAPILGQGFGATVTYQTSDPRILEYNPSGKYTTYAFEWGWLDVWLKLGLFGILAYLFLFVKIIFDNIKINSYFSLSLIVSLTVVMIVNISSPYINHPLGIGFLILAAVLTGLSLNTLSSRKF